MKLEMSPRLALVVIAALFILPLLLAWLMYSGVIEFTPGTTRNHGQLVQPPVPLDWEAGDFLDETRPADLLEHWVVLADLPSPCGAPCLATVTDLRQVHRASGRQQSRIRLVLLLDEDRPPQLAGDLHEVYANFKLLTDPRAGLSTALAKTSGAGNAGTDGTIYLVDPLGNIMMFYPSGADPNHLKQDLKRLLTWSKLDEQ